jgi:hypothetical protein
MSKGVIKIEVKDKLLYEFLKAIGPEEMTGILEKRFLESVDFDFGIRGDLEAIGRYVSNNKEVIKKWIKEEVAQ